MIPLIAAAAAVVALDVGHTPASPGSLGASGATEYGYNLDMAARIETWLHRYGIATRRVAPRSGNDLVGRARQSAGSDLLLSVHHDSSACAVAIGKGDPTNRACVTSEGRRATMRDMSGFSVWESGRNIRYDQSLVCARDVATSLSGGGAHPSMFHSWTLPDEARTPDSTPGVYRRDGLAVVSDGPVPAILVEVAVIANPSEERWRSRGDVADAIASFIARGIRTCLNGSPQF